MTLKGSRAPKAVLLNFKLLRDGKLTNAAVLLFGKDPRRFFNNIQVHCLHFFGTEKRKPIASQQPYEGRIKVVNTGTIERFICLWGRRALTHGGQKYMTPYLPLGRAGVTERRSSLYRSPKLIFAKMAKVCEAFYDEKGEYASVNTNCIYSPSDGVSLSFLAGYCNSSLFMFFYEQYFGSLRMSGGYFQFQAPQLRVMPLRKPDKQCDKAMQSIVSDIMTAKSEDPAADTTTQERKVDEIVYRLFDLTPDEIALIENALFGTRRGAAGSGEEAVLENAGE